LTTSQAPTYKDDVHLLTLSPRRQIAVLAGLIGPAAACAALTPVRDSFPTTDAALVLVAVIVAIAALGSRTGGLVAALSAGVWFDFFLTRPYETFSINTRPAIETTVLLFIIGIAVTEISAWGRREHFRAGQQSGYLTGLHAAAEVVATGGSPTRLTGQVADQLSEILQLKSCHFHYGTGLGNPRLQHDGRLSRGTKAWDVDNRGLPTGEETELLVSAGGRFHGRFLMTPIEDSRPNLTQRLVAVALADQVGAALGEYDLTDKGR
jgi:K+-sensing histidine kinase KdpD